MPKDLEELLRRYAKKGLAEWHKLSPNDRKATVNWLGLKIVENNWQIQNTIRPTGNAMPCFIPMPKVNHRGIKHCFFLPIGSPHENGMKFELFLVIDEKNCLGFRFETADSEGTHNYSHVQITPQMTVSAKGIPPWLPESYPAFPMGSSEPLDMFLYMATAVHGYKDGMQRVIQEIYQEDPGIGKSILQRWQERLQIILRSKSSTRTDGSSENNHL